MASKTSQFLRDSIGECCTDGLGQLFSRGHQIRGFPRPGIEQHLYLGDAGVGDITEVGALGQKPADESVGVFVGAALPRRMRVTEERPAVGGDSNLALPDLECIDPVLELSGVDE